MLSAHQSLAATFRVAMTHGMSVITCLYQMHLATSVMTCETVLAE